MEGVARPTRHDMLMGVAQVIATRGTCNRLSVGAVISREGRILSTGYNGPPAGLPHCQHDATEVDNKPCVDAVHAEANSVAFAAKHGVSTAGAEAYVTHSPCINCAKLLINAGISQVIFRIPFRDLSGVALLYQANVPCLLFNGGNHLEYREGDQWLATLA